MGERQSQKCGISLHLSRTYFVLSEIVPLYPSSEPWSNFQDHILLAVHVNVFYSFFFQYIRVNDTTLLHLVSSLLIGSRSPTHTSLLQLS